MKKLLGMARQKKKDQPQSEFMSLPKQRQSQPSQQEYAFDDDDEDYTPTNEELIIYAQYIGIRLPEDQDLLYIAREGLSAELPADWTNSQTNNGQVLYINLQTGEKTFQHPCDKYFKQLVIKQRIKKGTKSAISRQPQQSFNLPSGMKKIQPTPSSVDPLIKGQQEKQKKKLIEESQKKQQQKKKNLKEKAQNKINQRQNQLKKKQQLIRDKYEQEITDERQRINKKTKTKQKNLEDQNKKMLQQYEKQTRNSIQRIFKSKKQIQIDNMNRKIKQKKDQIQQELEKKVKQQRKIIDEEYKKNIKELEDKQRQIKSKSLKQNQSLQIQIEKMKKQVAKNRIKQNTEQIRKQTEKQKQAYQRQVNKMQEQYNERVTKLQQFEPKNTFKYEQVIKQSQKQEKQELKLFQYQLQSIKKLKQAQNQCKIEDLKINLRQKGKKAIEKLNVQFQHIIKNYTDLKEQDYQQKIWQCQKKAKQDYLHSIKGLQQKYNLQQQIVRTQNQSTDKSKLLQIESMQGMNHILKQLNWQQNNIRKQLDSIRLEIQNLRSQNNTVTGKMNQNQMKLFNIIQHKIRDNNKKQ